MGPTDPDPRGGSPFLDAQVTYPWHVGHWYDLAVVTPQNYALDLDQYHYEWLSRRWVDAGAARAVVDQAMAYYFPWWCGWGYWAWWWHGGDCVDIGVGEGESIDVEQVSPIRIFMSEWPPNS